MVHVSILDWLTFHWMIWPQPHLHLSVMALRQEQLWKLTMRQERWRACRICLVSVTPVNQFMLSVDVLADIFANIKGMEPRKKWSASPNARVWYACRCSMEFNVELMWWTLSLTVTLWLINCIRENVVFLSRTRAINTWWTFSCLEYLCLVIWFWVHNRVLFLCVGFYRRCMFIFFFFKLMQIWIQTVET